MPDLNLLPYCRDERQETLVKMRHKGAKVREVAEVLGIDQRNVYLSLNRIKDRAAANGYTATEQVEGLTAKSLRKAKTIVITSAQNNTKLVTPFFDALKVYAEENDAQLGVILARYRNPDAFHVGSDSADTWPDEVMPYAIDKNMVLSKNLIIMGGVKIRATAVNPLSSNEPLGKGASTIYGHPQLQMKMVATPKNKIPKMMHTTGSISEKNYGRSKDGQKAELHHSTAALVIQKRGGKFWIRELNYDGTGFYDLDKYYTPEGVTGNHRMNGIVFGDTHEKFLTEEFKQATYGKGSLCEKLKPETYIFHDIYDHYSGSHHHEQDFILRMVKHYKNDSDVKAELDSCAKFLDEVVPKGSKAVIVESNHHNHLTKWFNRFNPQKDLINAPFYFDVMKDVSAAAQQGIKLDPFVHYLTKKANRECMFIDPDKPYWLANIDISQHGDRGPNGSRGTPSSFARCANKMIGGHTHTPCIEKGYYGVGVSAPDLEYQTGLSSWMITHCGIYPNGKRTLLHMIDGKYYPED